MKKVAQIMFPICVCLCLALIKRTFLLLDERMIYAEATVCQSESGDSKSDVGLEMAANTEEIAYADLSMYSDIHDEVLLIKPYLVLAPTEANPMVSCMQNLTLYPMEHLQLEHRAGRDYEILLKIVEAEAGGESVEGKILVANVILNRMNSPDFPDTVEEVVYQVVEGYPQFTPTADGRIDTVTVTEETVEAVNRALDGEDLSCGALYFMASDHSEEHNVCWFENNLTWLFSYGGHDFYI